MENKIFIIWQFDNLKMNNSQIFKPSNEAPLIEHPFFTLKKLVYKVGTI
jgi:hypothetical protein